MIGSTLSMLSGLSNLAFAQLVSTDGKLKIDWLRSYDESCLSGEPHGQYILENALSGLLYPVDCHSISRFGDVSEYQFVDTDGIEQCTGSMQIGWTTNAVTVWRIEEPISGQTCSTAGETYEVMLRP
jgi:hypothetical protein